MLPPVRRIELTGWRDARRNGAIIDDDFSHASRMSLGRTRDEDCAAVGSDILAGLKIREAVRTPLPPSFRFAAEEVRGACLTSP
jgi:hypothetical protein